MTPLFRPFEHVCLSSIIESRQSREPLRYAVRSRARGPETKDRTYKRLSNPGSTIGTNEEGPLGAYTSTVVASRIFVVD